jgi:hypothetical protein
MLVAIRSHAHRIRRESILPRVQWDGTSGIGGPAIETRQSNQRGLTDAAFPSMGHSLESELAIGAQLTDRT